MKFFGQSCGHDANHAGMPATIGQHQRRIPIGVELFGGLFVGAQINAPFDTVAALVQFVEIGGQCRGPFGRIGREQLDAERGLAQPAGRVEPRRQHETDILARKFGLLVELRQFQKRRHAQARSFAQTRQSVPHQHAIFIDQRDHVAHRSQRHQSDGLHQKVPHRLADFFRLAGALTQCPGQLEGHAGTAQPGERIGSGGQARMHDRVGRRQRGADRMMIGDDQLQPELASPQRFGDARHTAIDGDDHLRATTGQCLKRVAIQTIAVVDAIGHVVADLGREQLEAQGQKRRAAHSVDVVIAVHDDSPTGGDGRHDAVGRSGYARQILGIAQAAQPGFEKVAGLASIVNAAA